MQAFLKKETVASNEFIGFHFAAVFVYKSGKVAAI